MSEVTIYCPPVGTTITGECYTNEVTTWNGSSINYVQFFVNALNKTLIKFDLTGVVNNGSDVQVSLSYRVDGVYEVVKTWNLGTLTQSISLYHFLDFGTTQGLNNYITLQFTFTGGSTGQIDVYFDCDVNVVSQLFCSGSTFSQACNCTSTVKLYAEANQNPLFPFQGSAWYVDELLQIEAPCGNYVPKSTNQTSFVNYNYNCITHLPEIYGYCSNPCETLICSGGTSTYTHTPATYTFANPLIETNTRTNKQTIDDDTFVFPNVNTFSKHCVTIEFPQGSVGIYSITVTYTGQDLPQKYITFEDAAYYKTVDSPGQLSISTTSPSNSPWFIPMAADYLEVFTGTTTYYIIPPKSGLVTVKFMIGNNNGNFQKPSTITTTITPSCTTTPIYKYDAGLHVYSSYDSIISPRLTTTVYSLTQLSSWQLNTTILFNDNWFVQPAFPYWYSISGTTYKVGDPLRRDWGTITQYLVTKKAFSRNVSFQKQSGPYKDQTILNLTNGERTIPICTHMLGSLGVLRDKITQANVIQPTKYKYFMGVAPYPNTTLIANKLASNDNYFTLIDTQFALSSDNCYPVTGFEHALVKLGEAYSILMPYYLDRFTGARKKYENFGNLLVSEAVGRSNMIFGIAVAFASLVALGALSSNGGGSGGSGNKFYDRGALKNYKLGPKKCPRWATNVPGVEQIVTLATANPQIALAILAIVAVATFLQWWIPMNRIVTECCKMLKVINTTGPYILVGNSVFLNKDLTTSYQTGWLCDGAYFYKIINGAVVSKEVSFTYHGVQYSPGGGIGLGTGPKTPSLIPDSPTYVTNITKLFFLPYVSGVPEEFVQPNPRWISTQKSGSVSTNSDVTGALYEPLVNEYILEEGYFDSDVSQADADYKAQQYFDTVTGETQSVFGGITYGPNIDAKLSIFTHEIKIENTPIQSLLYYNNQDNLGLTIGKKAYVDLGFSEALTGYYALSSDTAYRNFLLVLSGTVQDIFIMPTSTSTTVTSLSSGTTQSISQTNKDFTSGWYKRSLQPIYDNSTNAKWNSSEFYQSSEIVRGFVNNPVSAETFYVYSTNQGIANSYSEAESYYYKEILTGAEMFYYSTPTTLYINKVQECTLTGSGIDFQIVDVSGNSTNAQYGIVFDAIIYTANTFDSSHSISIQSFETNKFLELPFSYNGQITDVLISSYSSPNPVNKITYTGGTFTSCVAPTPSPTPTTPEASYTPTPTVTPTPTTEIYYYYSVNGYGCGTPCYYVGQFVVKSPIPLTIGYFYNNPENRGYTFEILTLIPETPTNYDLTNEPGYSDCFVACYPTTTPTPTPTQTPTPTPSTEPSPPLTYDHYYADKYDCGTCTLDTSNVLVAFPSGQTVNIGSWYPDTGSFSYYIQSSTLDTGGYILTNTFGSFGSCAAACGV